MDNLTHSLLGAALAEVALPPGRSRHAPRVFAVAGVVAANLPDLDLLYTSMTPPPLGYLLHHRGHTHTLVGLVAQAALLVLVALFVPPVRRLSGAERGRLWLLIAVGLLSHVVLDAGNSYGVHPFFPFDSRWYYGDAVFIFEPWLWLLLGLPVALLARRVTRVALLTLLALGPALLARVGVVPLGALAALIAAALPFAWALLRLSPRARAVTALSAGALFASVLVGLSGVARGQATGLLAPDAEGEILDVVLTPDPANPLCWSVIAVERNDQAGEYVMRPATLSLAPAWVPPTTCASHRFGGPRPSRDVGGRLALYDDIRQRLDGLRRLRERDCWARAWLQFGRAPLVRDGGMADLRFDRGGDNFTAMRLRPPAEAAACPPHLTRWDPPRADLFAVPSVGGAPPPSLTSP